MGHCPTKFFYLPGKVANRCLKIASALFRFASLRFPLLRFTSCCFVLLRVASCCSALLHFAPWERSGIVLGFRYVLLDFASFRFVSLRFALLRSVWLCFTLVCFVLLCFVSFCSFFFSLELPADRARVQTQMRVASDHGA